MTDKYHAQKNENGHKFVFSQSIFRMEKQQRRSWKHRANAIYFIMLCTTVQPYIPLHAIPLHIYFIREIWSYCFDNWLLFFFCCSRFRACSMFNRSFMPEMKQRKTWKKENSGEMVWNCVCNRNHPIAKIIQIPWKIFNISFMFKHTHTLAHNILFMVQWYCLFYFLVDDFVPVAVIIHIQYKIMLWNKRTNEQNP